MLLSWPPAAVSLGFYVLVTAVVAACAGLLAAAAVLAVCAAA